MRYLSPLRRLRVTLMVTAAFCCSLGALQGHALASPNVSIRQRQHDSAHAARTIATLLRDDGKELQMKILNTSARVVHFNVPGGPVSVPPLGSVTLTGEQEATARALLAGVWKPLVDDGSLVIDGARLQPAGIPPADSLPPSGTLPSSSEPSSPSTPSTGSADPLPPSAATVDTERSDQPTGAKRGRG